MKKVLVLVAVFGLGGCVGYLLATKPPSPQPGGSLVPGTPITVVRPTGKTITMKDGKNPVPETETVHLVVYRVRGGEHHTPPEGRGVWQLTFGGTTVYAVPE